jgi:hypothetical protein
MRITELTTLSAAVLLTMTVGILASRSFAHAEPQPALDRALVERLVRAQEAQVHALEALTRAAERCK